MKRILKQILLLMSFMAAISLTCYAKDSYTQISQDEAREMMEKEDGHIVIDVRRQDEYDEGHIPGAICVPNESIGCDSPEALPDYDQIILIYCRSGRRSKEAAQKLAGMGYTNIYEYCSDQRLHHIIYLSDARKVDPEKLKTVIRHPIRKE